MSEPRLISPLLDDFDVGGAISEHDGVRCCPAMRKNTDDKYIVKIISVPASQTKMDALLLTGAYSTKEAALAYFEDVADGIANEKKILDDLAKLEGFVPFEDCQVVPKEDGSGYDVYLLSQYRLTLQRQNARTPMTQLDAVNLGLDLCAGLSACRRSGYLSVDLKPSNIYIVGDKEYKIGDLGFMRLNSLKYKTLPDMYRSCYTAPEVDDPFSVLNDKLDVYAAGLILYQVFNGGVLPFSGNHAPCEKFAAPVYADEEMAEIILKACDPNPDDRWSDPAQMGQALVNYMQKNGVNDTLLAEPIKENQSDIPAEEPIDELAEERTADSLNDVTAFEDETIMPEEETSEADSSDVMISSHEKDDEHTLVESNVPPSIIPQVESEEVITVNDQALVNELSMLINKANDHDDEVDNRDLIAELSHLILSDSTDEPDDDNIQIEEVPPVIFSDKHEAAVEEADVTDEPEIEDTESKEENTENLPEETVTEGIDNQDVTEQLSDTESDDTPVEESNDIEYDNLSFLDGWEMDADKLLADSDDDYDSISTEISEMFDQIDALTEGQDVNSHVNLDQGYLVENTVSGSAAEDTVGTSEEITNEELEISEDELPYIPKKKRTGLVWCIVLAILIALSAGGYLFYTQYYLQPIHSLTLEGAEDMLQVYLTADIDESQLTIVCADSHGLKVTAPVVGGKAVFIGLTPDTAYTISVEVDGFHELTGTTSKIYSTPIQTKIAQMNAITGSESGSVIISFVVDGPDSEQWNIIYGAEGEAERVTAFPSHTVTLTGLTVGKEYSFRLEPIDDIYLGDGTELTYVAKNLVCAENLHVTACIDGALTAQWDTPEGETVAEWVVRCYNEFGYDETLITSDNTITFQNVDDSVENTVEVTAADMSVNQQLLVSANSVTISDFAVDTSKSDVLTLNWSSNRDIPENGWTILYSVNGVSASDTIVTTENSAQIPVVPDGTYVFTILDGSGNAVLGGPFTHVQGASSDFTGYDVDSTDITVRLCKTPAASSWSYSDLEDEDYVNSFSVGQKVSTVLALSKKPDDSNDVILVGFVIYDDNGNLVNYTHSPIAWQSMWYHNYCELDVPGIPSDIGTYKVVIYFNGANVGSQKFEITA